MEKVITWITFTSSKLSTKIIRLKINAVRGCANQNPGRFSWEMKIAPLVFRLIIKTFENSCPVDLNRSSQKRLPRVDVHGNVNLTTSLHFMKGHQVCKMKIKYETGPKSEYTATSNAGRKHTLATENTYARYTTDYTTEPSASHPVGNWGRPTWWPFLAPSQKLVYRGTGSHHNERRRPGIEKTGRK